MLSAPRVSGSVPVSMACMKSWMMPRWPPMRSAGSSGGTSIGLRFVEQPVAARHHHFRLQRVMAVPDQAAALGDDAPAAFPAGAETVGAPGAGIGEDLAAAEIEDGAGRRPLPVPGIGRLPFLAIDAGRLAADHVAGGVEGVDRHVEQQHMRHLLAKAAEMRRDEEVGMDAGRGTDGAGSRESAGCAGHWRHSGGSGRRHGYARPGAPPRRWRAHSPDCRPAAFPSADGNYGQRRKAQPRAGRREPRRRTPRRAWSGRARRRGWCR